MTSNNNRSTSYHRGFTLVEIMVGLAIGMLATLVIIQVMSVYETQKRTTTGTADAQTNGGIALYNIGRELQLAGYSLMPRGKAGVADSPLECTTTTFGTTGITSITPVTITDGVAVAGVSSASDTITITYGNSLSGGIPSKIGAAPVGNVVTLSSNFGCQVNDISLIVNGSTCAMAKVTAVGTTPSTTVTLDNTAAAIAGADLSCMGTWNTVTYAVNNGNLERNGVPSVAGIVNLQAQYGVSDTANSNQVTQWVDANGSTWAAPTVVDRNRIKAIRIAVVARNAKFEPVAVTASCSSTTAAAPTGLCAWEGVSVVAGKPITVASPAPLLSLSDGNVNWAHYRYRVYETIIPLRNTIWSKDTL